MADVSDQSELRIRQRGGIKLVKVGGGNGNKSVFMTILIRLTFKHAAQDKNELKNMIYFYEMHHIHFIPIIKQ